jgi:hypothetical protein
MGQYDADIKSQVDYAVRKYGGNLPPAVAKAQAEKLANEAMRHYNPSKGNVKTYLSKRLQKLSRIAYKASTPLNIPESRLMSRAKIRDFIDEYRDTYGVTPDHNLISKHTKVPLVDAKSYMMESAAINNESSFDNISRKNSQNHSSAILHSLPSDLIDIGKDIYHNNMKESDITKKYKIGRTTYFSKKKKIDNFLKSNSGLSNIEYR